MKRREGKREGRRESGKNQETVAKFKFYIYICILKPVLRALSLKETEREVRGRRFPHLLFQPVHAIPESEGISCLLLQPVDFSWGEGSTEQGREREHHTVSVGGQVWGVQVSSVVT